MQRVRKAVFPVAGLGTRILPATKAMPKEMLPVIDTPLIQHAVAEARAAGIEQMIFVTGLGKHALEDHFDRSPLLEATLEQRGKLAELQRLQAGELRDGEIIYVRQSRPLGLGHAVRCARHAIGNEPFAVLLPDDYCLAQTPVLQQMVEAYAETGGNLVAVTEVPREQTNRYGILDVAADDGRLVTIKGLVEKPEPDAAPSNLSIIGRYILQPEVFNLLAAGNLGAGGEIQLTDAMAGLIGRQPFHGLRYTGERFDCGDRVGYVRATLATALASPGNLQREIAAFARDRLAMLPADV